MPLDDPLQTSVMRVNCNARGAVNIVSGSRAVQPTRAEARPLASSLRDDDASAWLKLAPLAWGVGGFGNVRDCQLNCPAQAASTL